MDGPECSHPCDGTCCRGFTITTGTPESRAAKVGEIRVFLAGGGECEPWMRDYLMVSEMLLPLAPTPEGRELYGCRHHDATTGKCGVYAERPGMCRRYPIHEPQRRCVHCGFVAPEG